MLSDLFKMNFFIPTITILLVLALIVTWGALFCILVAIAEAHGRAVARTVQPLVGHSESGAE